jgi:hypothetical protein
MEDKIQQVKIEFNKIKDIRNNVAFCFNALENKQTKLKAATSEFVKNNRNNIFVFGLDSFQFQSKLIDYEYNDMKKFYLALNNRMYCEYYKLYKIILQYAEDIIGTNKTIEMLKFNNIFPIYKDLEPLKQYNFDTIEELHKTIISLLNTLNEHILFKESQLQLFQKKQKSGLNINNFVNTFDFDVVVIKQKCLLFLSYLDFFHVIHTKHFKRFSKKMKLMNDYLDEDIKFDEELQHREDESLKSYASTASFDFNDVTNININTNIVTDKPSIKSLFNSNVKKEITKLNVFKPNNINTNINDMLDSLSQSFDTDINDIRSNIIDTITAAKLETIEANIDTFDGILTDTTTEITETINAHKIEGDNNINETDIVVNDALKISNNIETIVSIYGNKIEDTITTIDTVKDPINLKQMVDIFNTKENEMNKEKEGDNEAEDGEEEEDAEETSKGEPNNKKKKKKKKKK